MTLGALIALALQHHADKQRAGRLIRAGAELGSRVLADGRLELYLIVDPGTRSALAKSRADTWGPPPLGQRGAVRNGEECRIAIVPRALAHGRP
jgi:hypothetical protein